MSSFNLVQIVPALESGGVERGTIDVSNYLSSKNLSNHIISSGGNLLNEINKEFTSHCLLPVNSKNFLRLVPEGFNIDDITHNTKADPNLILVDTVIKKIQSLKN